MDTRVTRTIVLLLSTGISLTAGGGKGNRGKSSQNLSANSQPFYPQSTHGNNPLHEDPVYYNYPPEVQPPYPQVVVVQPGYLVPAETHGYYDPNDHSAGPSNSYEEIPVTPASDADPNQPVYWADAVYRISERDQEKATSQGRVLNRFYYLHTQKICDPELNGSDCKNLRLSDVKGACGGDKFKAKHGKVGLWKFKAVQGPYCDEEEKCHAHLDTNHDLYFARVVCENVVKDGKRIGKVGCFCELFALPEPKYKK